MPSIIKSRNVESVRYNDLSILQELQSDEEIAEKKRKEQERLEAERKAAEAEAAAAATKQPEFDVEAFLEKVRAQAEQVSNDLLERARAEAEEYAQSLRDGAAEEGREQGYKEGYNDGYSNGYVEAYEKGLKAVNNDCDRLLCEIQAGLELFREEKKELEKKNLEGMKELSISIAEKITSMNFKSQSDVIEHMIISALDSSKSTQWIKIYISGFDSERYFEIEKELLESVKHISEFVKVEVIEGAEEGTCIIEMPDKIIDASINTQLSNIKNMLDE